jgi:hypothetical protein
MATKKMVNFQIITTYGMWNIQPVLTDCTVKFSDIGTRKNAKVTYSV